MKQEQELDQEDVTKESVVPMVNAIPSDMDPKLKAKIQRKSEAERKKKRSNRRRGKEQRAARRRQRRG